MQRNADNDGERMQTVNVAQISNDWQEESQKGIDFKPRDTEAMKISEEES